MISRFRKSSQILKRVAGVFDAPASAPKYSGKSIPRVPEAAPAAVASDPVYPVCHVCGVAAGIWNTADSLGGKLAGECMSCGALRPVE